MAGNGFMKLASLAQELSTEQIASWGHAITAGIGYLKRIADALAPIDLEPYTAEVTLSEEKEWAFSSQIFARPVKHGYLYNPGGTNLQYQYQYGTGASGPWTQWLTLRAGDQAVFVGTRTIHSLRVRPAISGEEILVQMDVA